MAKYTIELRKVCDIYGRETVESWFKEWKLEDYLTEEEIEVINTRGVFSKDKLATQIVDNYFMREIGLETPSLFKLQTINKMRRIMEKYSPLIYSASIKYDPLVNVDYTETYNREINNSGNTSGLTVSSDTPQGQINKEQILAGKYASATSAGNSEDTSQSLESSSKTIKGNSGVSATAQKMIQQYRENIITINNNIIEELNILFMGLF